ncbi:hypothetical protein PFL02_00660 [Pseudomonas fluorescens]|nr:hypothetical protein PFL02_00660 [Pseudomonas fluorescens]
MFAHLPDRVMAWAGALADSYANGSTRAPSITFKAELKYAYSFPCDVWRGSGTDGGLGTGR